MVIRTCLICYEKTEDKQFNGSMNLDNYMKRPCPKCKRPALTFGKPNEQNQKIQRPQS